ncbi:MAG: sugar phosphate isomerase/epimerase [Paenibacillaceae bacterium]|nr:sugar phosphate isomerase/epimerase [Paenibacillaceae bacterium]
MIRTGLLSVTFRKKTPEEIIRLVQQAGLDGIEWGGDVHVPHNDAKRAAEVGKWTKEAGLALTSFGSYYYTGGKTRGNSDNPRFENVLETAIALGVPAIRVWAGDRPSEEADEQWRRTVADDTRRIADLAAQAGITIDFEYHNHTLTDTPASAEQLLREIDHTNVRSNWQAPLEMDAAQRLDSLRGMLPWLANVHVFHWTPSLTEQRKLVQHPLAEGKEEWIAFLRTINQAGRSPFAMLEFVKGESDEQFLQDAATLKEAVAASV